MTTEKLKLICEEAIKKLLDIEQKMINQEKRLDRAFENFEKAVLKLK